MDGKTLFALRYSPGTGAGPRKVQGSGVGFRRLDVSGNRPDQYDNHRLKTRDEGSLVYRLSSSLLIFGIGFVLAGTAMLTAFAAGSVPEPDSHRV